MVSHKFLIGRMGREDKFEVEAGVLGVGKAKFTRTTSPTEIKYSYSCVVDFSSLENAREFREIVEKAVPKANGEISQSHIDTLEKTKQ